MTSTLSPTTAKRPASDATSIEKDLPKKRRRRTTAGGAVVDCFACIGRAVKCDRKRPYCTQCLEIGKGCSGYKTTLTWGVGVASRGKLRGLSCPIAHKNVDGSDATPKEVEVWRRRKISVAKVKEEEADHLQSRGAAPRAGLPTLHQLQTVHDSRYDRDNIPDSGRSGSYAKTEYYSPNEYPHTPL